VHGVDEGTHVVDGRLGQPAVPEVQDVARTPAGALQDWQIFARLLDESYAGPDEIFAALAREIPAYGGLDYEKIGALGADLEAQRQ